MRSVLIVVASLIAIPALAQEPVGCDKFKWPIDRERALLAEAKPIANGGDAANAVKLSLSPTAELTLPAAPSREPKPNTHAGYVRYAAPPHAGTYRVTISQPAWIDVVQDGREIKSGAFTGATGCEGIRKSVKFDLAASPFVVEISGSPANDIAIAVTPD